PSTSRSSCAPARQERWVGSLRSPTASRPSCLPRRVCPFWPSPLVKGERFSRPTYKCLGISYRLLLVLSSEPRPAKRSRSPATKPVRLRPEKTSLYMHDERRSAKSTRPRHYFFSQAPQAHDPLLCLDCACI